MEPTSVLCPGSGGTASTGPASRDDSGEWERRAKSIARDMIREAALIDDEDERKQQLAHALRTESEPRLRAMMSLATSERQILTRVDGLDADPMLLNVANGTVDLRTGRLRSHSRGDLLTRAGIC
jgi:putative DNA primase/helicase